MMQRPVMVWGLWLGLYVITTLLVMRVSAAPEVLTAHGVMAYLVLIIGASRHGGRLLSVVMVVLGYLGVAWCCVPPRFTFAAVGHLDWFILIGFALTGLLISELFAGLQRAVRVARERTEEAERLGQERLQLEREASTARVLREADRIKNALLNSIAHDLRSPVATLSLLSDPVAGFRPTVALERVREESLRLGAFLATLQRFATNEGEVALATASLELSHLVKTALHMAEARLRHHDVRVQLIDDGSSVTGDLTLSVHILGNLLQNAARYAPPSAPIDVRVSRDEDWVEIMVADRGPGIAEGDVERIFSPLRRPSRAPTPTSTDDDPRMGMGLAIARTFARAQRGDVYYRPRTGGGSEFVLKLPRAADDVSARSRTAIADVPVPVS